MNDKTKKEIKEGITKTFELLEVSRSLVADEMLKKVVTLVKIMADGEVKERKDEGDALVESINKDQEKIDKLSKLIEVKEEYIKLFED